MLYRAVYGMRMLKSSMREPKLSSPDPARTIALLWGLHTKAGRSGLSVHAIVQAAIALVDEAGLEALSMRRIAERLQVGTMSLYTHVPGKPEVIELMIDTVYGELYERVDVAASQPGGWRGSLEYIAARNWALFQQHPWLVQVTGGRPVLGPNASLKYEAELCPLEGVGLSDVEMDAVLTLVLTHVEGVARLAQNQVQAQRESGVTDAEWWLVNGPLLERVMEVGRFPVATRVGRATGEAYGAAFSPAHALRFGLERILDGVADLISFRTGDATVELP